MVFPTLRGFPLREKRTEWVVAALSRREIKLYPWVFSMKEFELGTGSGLSLCENPEAGIILSYELYFLSFLKNYICLYALILLYHHLITPRPTLCFSLSYSVILGRRTLQSTPQAPLLPGFQLGLD